jgi:sugar lactone lactonase YvrE
LAAVGAVAVAVAVIGGGLGSPPPAGGSTPTHRAEVVSAAVRAQITEDLHHLLSDNAWGAPGRGFVQGYDQAMASALQSAAARSTYSVPTARLGMEAGTFTETVGRMQPAGPATITVPVTFTMKGETPAWSTSNHFVGTAVRTGGRWKVSWATACTLVEVAGVVCPTAPKGIEATLPLPFFDPPQATAAQLAPGLVDPSGMAVEPDGNLLIADTGRDQVLLRTSSGQLEVFAGTGTAGFSGDGGPATQADLDLDGPVALAVSPTGTVYITDTQNHRVRAVSPSGIITTVAGDGVAGHTGDGEPAVDAELENPTGVAVGPDGSLYVADGTYLRAVAPNGIITTLAGGGPPDGVDITTDGPPVSFLPQSLAFDGAGNLDVFSFSPKVILQLPAGPSGPSGGDIKMVAQDYANALAPDPDGGVVVALHGTGIQRIVGGQVDSLVDFATTPIAGYGVAGMGGVFSPQGVAVAPDGNAYAATSVGNGYSSQMALIQITPTGQASVLPVVGPATATLPPLDAPGFPAAVYPAPARAPSGSGMASCPSSAGLQPFDSASRAVATAEAEQFNTNFFGALRSADRSWWASTYGEWADPTSFGRHRAVTTQPADRDLYAPAIAHACGSRIVDLSIAVVVGPSEYSEEVSHFFFIDRGGHPLVYYQNA